MLPNDADEVAGEIWDFVTAPPVNGPYFGSLSLTSELLRFWTL